jgi:L-seryl-tRNA(Ser) seleniumtransferase
MDPRSHVNPDPRSELPSVDRLSRQLVENREEIPYWAARVGARDAIAEARNKLEDAAVPEGAEELCGQIEQRAEALALRLVAPQPRRVVNATGIVLHTNLGRAPLGRVAAAAVAEAAAGYSDLELDLETGRRGNRLGAVCEKLSLLAGAEAAYACNNNAAAVLLVLDTLARGREVIVSRGELVEIGGSFRVPDVMERAGVRLVEVGSTNRTHLRDYERAIGPDTALLLKVHRSNFEQTGFVAEVDLPALVELGRQREIPVVEDLGSGTLVDLAARGLNGFPAEAFAPARVATGADLVCFSGDKLLGGPQAGLLIGRAEVVEAIRTNPLARALRLDKLGIAALGATLSALLDDRLQDIPVLQQLLMPLAEIESRARALAKACEERVGGALEVTVEPQTAPVGGGSLPGFALETRVVALSGRKATQLAESLRRAPTPVIARLQDQALLLDPRTLLEGDTEALLEALETALGPRDRPR